MKIKLMSLFLTVFSTISLIAVPLQWAIVTDQNKRDYQEDRAICIEMANEFEKQGDFFGVYDGHGGSQTSEMLEQTLHGYFAFALRKWKDVEDAFFYAFLQAEQYALQSFDDGSTAVAVYIDNNNMLHVAWVGDSRLVVDGGLITDDHKPDRPDEKERIENEGGQVIMHGVARVDGLAVSRSIGDRKIKHNGHLHRIIAVPEYAQYQLSENNHFIIVASDGLWDVVSNDEAIELVKERLDDGQSCNTAAYVLKEEAINRGSQDNITVMIVQFDWSK